MTWIKTIRPEEAELDLRRLYDAIASARGGVAEVHRVQSLNPRVMRAHLEIYKAIMFAGSPLGRIARERIAVVVSAANRCTYCIAHHTEALAQLGDDHRVIEALAAGHVPDGIAPADRALLRWARQAALTPHQCEEAQIAELRAHGLDDRAILDAALTIAYFSFINRVVLLLGVDVEQEYRSTCAPPPDDA